MARRAFLSKVITLPFLYDRVESTGHKQTTQDLDEERLGI